MNEKGVIFNAEEVCAVLDGRKTQIRRVCKPQPEGKTIQYKFGEAWDVQKSSWVGGNCPYGKPGDRLWVRETFCLYQEVHHTRKHSGASFSEIRDGEVAYKADGFDDIKDVKDHMRLTSSSSFEDIITDKECWTPSIHMKRKHSRINLEITDIRVERVQDISEGDAEAEGFRSNNDYAYSNRSQLWFKYLWDSLNKKRGHGWDVNPWVWVVEFKKL